MMDKELDEIRTKKLKELLKIQAMPKEIVNILSKPHFNEILNEYPNKIMIMDFWASWCGPCLQFSPIFEKLQEEFSTDFIFAKVNVDSNQEIANQYSISAIPTLLFVRDGAIINKIVGSVNYQNLRSFLLKLRSENN